MNRSMSHRPAGVVVIAVLVCLLIASAMVTTTTRSALQSRREVKRDHQLRQAELLLDAGVLRAAEQLRLDPQYEGETWRVDQALSTFDHARLEISVARSDDQGMDPQVTVTAILGQPGRQDPAARGEPDESTATEPLAIRRTTVFALSLPIETETDSTNDAE